METPFWLWAAFAIIVIAALGFDLGVVGRKKGTISVRLSLLLTAGYVTIALAFGGIVVLVRGGGVGVEYFTSYLLEESLSLDNIFVFILIFSHFQVPGKYQHKVLFWGVMGAMLMRGALIFLGAQLIRQVHWVIYIFAVIVIVSGIRILLKGEGPPNLEDDRMVRFLRKYLPVTDNYEGKQFIVHHGDKHCVTPLLLTLIVIELTDLMFALDSISAIFGITRDPFVIYTSNVFAILGLRALYFALSGIVRRFRYLKYGLSLVLVLIGAKMIADAFIEIPVWAVLGLLVAVVAGSVLLSLLKSGGAVQSEGEQAHSTR